MSAPINAMRASRASDALSAACADELCDLLADLLHYCDENEIDFDAELETARMHYRFEGDAPDDLEEAARAEFSTP